MRKNILHSALYFKQKCLHVFFVFVSLFFFGGFSHLSGDNDFDPTFHRTGAIPLTQEQVTRLEANWPRILSVWPNKYGAARIEEYLEKIGQPVIAIDIATTPEEEFITNKSAKAENRLAQVQQFTLPPAVDNSKLVCFPPIGNQAQQGSCVGFASTYYQGTHEYGLINGINNKTNSQNILSPKWTYNMLNNGVDGGLYPSDGYDLLNKNGAVSIVNFPYDYHDFLQWDLKQDDWISALSHRMSPPMYLYVSSPQDIDAMKQILNNGHILTTTTYIYSWVPTQVKVDPSTSNNPYAGQAAVSWMNGSGGYHHTSIVGYDDNIWIDVNNNGVVDSGEKGAFLIANSWGTSWGNSGFMWVAYDAFYKTSTVSSGPSAGRVALSDRLYTTVALSPNYRPKIVGKFTLNQANRSQIVISGGSSNINLTSPATLFNSKALNRSGGSYAFDGGTTRALTASFALDLTDLLSSINSTQRYYLKLSDVASGNTTTLNAFSLLDLVHNQEVVNSTTPLYCDNAFIQPFVDYNFTNNVDPSPPTVSITSPTDGSNLSGTVYVTANATDNVSVSRVDFYVDSTLISSNTDAPYMTSINTTKFANGTHQFTAIAYDAAGNSAKSSVTVMLSNSNGTSVYLNTGGAAVQDVCSGVTWQEDKYYTGGGVYTNSNLSGCLEVYKTERYGNVVYNIPISNGNKIVVLRFAEIWFTSTGQRVFNVKINDQTVISNLDIFKEVGFGIPLERYFPVNVTNNNVKIELISVVQNAKISGIGIVAQ